MTIEFITDVDESTAGKGDMLIMEITSFFFYKGLTEVIATPASAFLKRTAVSSGLVDAFWPFECELVAELIVSASSRMFDRSWMELPHRLVFNALLRRLRPKKLLTDLSRLKPMI
jgi:hypothetical protein